MCFYKFLAFMDLLKKQKQKSVLEVFLSGGGGGGWSGEAIFPCVV